MIGSMTHGDVALLVSEWSAGEHGGLCPSCKGQRPSWYDGETELAKSLKAMRSEPEPYRGHHPNCAHDFAIAERSFPDQESRDRARALIEREQSAETVPAPSPEVEGPIETRRRDR